VQHNQQYKAENGTFSAPVNYLQCFSHDFANKGALALQTSGSVSRLMSKDLLSGTNAHSYQSCAND